MACHRSLSALLSADVADQHSTLPLGWVVSPVDDLGTDMWVFGLNLVPFGSTDRIRDVCLVLEPYERVTAPGKVLDLCMWRCQAGRHGMCRAAGIFSDFDHLWTLNSYKHNSSKTCGTY